MSPLNKDKRWEGRPWAARLIKFIAFAGPLIISVLASYGNVLDTTAVDDFDGTRITHAFNGTTESSCCYGN